MLKKKLVTLACAVGILACGACFLPPLPEHLPAPPPVQLELQGVHRIHVVVENASPAHHLDSDKLASWIAVRAKSLGRSKKVTAFGGPSAPDQDGELKVTVLSETATPAQNAKKDGSAEWTFQVNVSAELRNTAGVSVWRENAGNAAWTRSVASHKSTPSGCLADQLSVMQASYSLLSCFVSSVLS